MNHGSLVQAQNVTLQLRQKCFAYRAEVVAVPQNDDRDFWNRLKLLDQELKKQFDLKKHRLLAVLSRILLTPLTERHVPKRIFTGG
jgi:hypothetical protein